MNLKLVLKSCFILEAIFIGLVNGIDMIIKQEKEGKVCFTLYNSTSNETLNSLVSVDLFVRYPQTIAEAGYVDLEELTPGYHELWYKYRITNLTHGLEVKLDGESVKFTKPKIPRWYAVSLFHEVAVAFQGDFDEVDCSNNRSKEEDKGLSLSNSFKFGLQVFTSSTKKPLTENDDKILSSNFEPIKTESDENDVKNASVNEIFLSHNLSSHINATTTINSLTTLKLEESNHLPSAKEAVVESETSDKEETPKPRKQSPDQINISIEIPSETLNRRENLLPTILPDLNYSDFENSGAESSQSCLNGDCEGQYNHDYTVAMCLIGILCALVLIAIVISVVFHRKKKKLMISSRARPNNKLRQQIFETEIAGESQLMLRQMENTYEEIP